MIMMMKSGPQMSEAKTFYHKARCGADNISAWYNDVMCNSKVCRFITTTVLSGIRLK